MAVKKITPETVIIIQARMGSSRLPGKSMRTIFGRPLLSYLIERVMRCNSCSKVIVATTTNPRDRQIVDFCHKEGISCYIGSEEDVLERYLYTAQEYGGEVIVRITGDCPLIDPVIIEEVVDAFVESYPKYDYASNVFKRTYPRGMDVEVISLRCLQSLFHYARTPDEREHVTPYIYHHLDQFSTLSITQKNDQSNFRLTVDTEEDFLLVKKIVEELYPIKSYFNLGDIMDLLKKHPDWVKINAHVQQKKVKH